MWSAQRLVSSLGLKRKDYADIKMSVAGVKKVKKVPKTSTKKGDGETITQMTTTVTSETSGTGSENFIDRYQRGLT